MAIIVILVYSISPLGGWETCNALYLKHSRFMVVDFDNITSSMQRKPYRKLYNFCLIYFFRPRTVTRGVSKDAKEDFKTAFEKQVLSSTGCVQSLVIRFLTERREEVLSPLST